MALLVLELNFLNETIEYLPGGQRWPSDDRRLGADDGGRRCLHRHWLRSPQTAGAVHARRQLHRLDPEPRGQKRRPAEILIKFIKTFDVKTLVSAPPKVPSWSSHLNYKRYLTYCNLLCSRNEREL
jgi:hypothetical protein